MSNDIVSQHERILAEHDHHLGDLIAKGFRVMVLMRGLPGAGKTYTARAIIKNYVDLHPPYSNIGDFIFSTDDYFYNRKGIYKYNVMMLSEAHDFNQNRVQEKTSAGLSPIIIDNTNMKLWEMIPYVKYAVENGYLIQIVEVQPTWNKCAFKLSQRNIHGVPADRIRRMMDKYEKGNVADLLRMLKTTKYAMSLPQLRSVPPIISKFPEKFEDTTVVEDAATEKTVFENITTEIPTAANVPHDSNWSTYETNAPKVQRKKFKSSKSPPKVNNSDRPDEPAALRSQQQSESSQYPMKSSSARDVYGLLEQKLSTAVAWKPYEAESIDFWGADRGHQKLMPSHGAEYASQKQTGEKSLLELLRDDVSAVEETKQTKPKEIIPTNTFKRHSIGCNEENPAFVTLRQIYPNKQVSGLWDLFLKCNGDIDWAVDILLKEDELAKLSSDSDTYAVNNDDDKFVCSCHVEIIASSNVDDYSYATVNRQTLDNQHSILNTGEVKLPYRPQRSKYTRHNHFSDPALLEVKENLENCFVLGDDHYSKHILKIKNFRSGIASDAGLSSETKDSGDNVENLNVNKDNDDEDQKIDDDDDELGNNDNQNDDMLEMSLGDHLVQQLMDNFRNESSLEERIPPSLPLNLKVFMPRSLAKQLYMLWMESAYNHLEEERQKIVREDEEFARLLKHPKYCEYKQSPSNMREMLDIEYAWNLYKRDKEELDQQRSEIENLSEPSDLAAHLTQMKLCETFPDIPRETLIDILASTENNYMETVSILRSTMNISETQEEEGLQQRAMRAHDEYVKRKEINKPNVWDENENLNVESGWSAEDAKRLALTEFEDARNLAAHHCQLRAECYQKAKESIQAGNGGAGLYYSQIANLHKQKMDMYNNRAANCIMNVHKYTQNNPDHLDLHYLHLLEAIGCLDLFLDRHITALRLASRNYKYVFIITGRGKHSAGGYSIIKNKVKARLEERSLKWNEVNPGLLKVKVFSSSRHSQNF